MKTLSRRAIQRMISNTNIVGGGGSGSSGGGSGGGTADYATNAGHADTADEATHATNADNAANAAYATLAGSASVADKLAENSSDWYKIARKDIAQTIAGVWTFAKGIISTLKSYFNGGIEVTNGTKTDTLQATGNATVGGTLGVTGNATIGGTLGVTGKLTGVDAEFQNLEITKEAHFKKLVVDEMLSNKGAIIISSANCVAEIVETVSGGYGVFFGTKDANGNSVTNSWRVGDQALCLTFNGEGAGTFSDVRNRYYWRKVTQVLSNTTYGTGTYHYIKLSSVSGEYDGSTTPAAGDNIVQLGYRGTDAAYRQSAVILSSYPTMDSGVKPPSLAFYKGISTFSLISNRYTYMDGLTNEFIGNFKILVNGSYTNLTTVLATLEGIIMGVKSIVRGKNILQVDGWTDGSGNLLGATNYTEATMKFTNDDGSGVASDILFSPVFFLKAGTYTYSHYSSNDEVELYVYQDSGNFVIDNLPESDSYPVTLTRSGDTYQGVLRRYCTFTLNSDSYVCLNLYHDSFVFDAYRPMLEEGDSCSNWETGTVEHTSQIKILSNAINLSIRAGLLTTGINITDGTIKLIADKVNFYDSAGQNLNSLIWIDPTTGTLHAVNAFLSGSLLCHRMVRRSGSEPYVVCFSGNTAATLALLGDIVVVGGQYSSNLPVRLPPAKFFPGAHIKILNATYSTSGGNRTKDPSIITLEVVHNNNTEPRAEDVYNVATNSLAVAVPFVAASGSNIIYYDYYEYLTYNAYIEVDLVSEPNIYENPTSPTHYVWTVIGAQKG